MTRNQLVASLFDRMARDMAEDIIKHNLTPRECYLMTADLVAEARHYADKLIAEDAE